MSEIDEQNGKDMEAIARMIERAEQEGLLVEVLWSLIGSRSTENIDVRCRDAMNEWDV